MRKSCVIYGSWADQILNLPKDVAGEYIQAILQYAIYGEEMELEDPILNAMLIPVKKKLDEDMAKYQAQVDRMNKNRGQKEVSMKSSRSQFEVASDTDTDTVTDIKKKNNKKKKNTFHNFPEREYDYSELKAGADHV